MSDETKKPFDLGPILPMFGAGIDLGERLGDLAAGQKQARTEIQELKAEVKALDTKTDKMAYTLNRLDERTKNMTIIGGGILIAVVAGLVLQVLSM